MVSKGRVQNLLSSKFSGEQFYIGIITNNIGGTFSDAITNENTLFSIKSESNQWNSHAADQTDVEYK